MKVSYDQYKEFGERFGHIFTRKNFPITYYALNIDSRANRERWDQAGHSGIVAPCSIAGSKNYGTETGLSISIEAQLLGGNGKDAEQRSMCVHGTNIVMNGKLITDHCVSSQSKTYHGDQWVTAEMLVLGDSLIKHIMEGKLC
jgi:hypothetical protein